MDDDMKRFINVKNNIVTEALDGFLTTTPTPGLARLDGYPHTKVIVRTDWDKSRVALISGGGSGHEPAHAGFVGEGMLTAAVCGDIFASPSVEAVLAAIMAVTGEAGCLLVVKNYTGDRLNFGLAAERAKSLGYKVDMVIVADDIAIPEAHHPRGLAGTLFVHKIAGFLAAQGASLEVLSATAQAVASASYSIGLSLNSCTMPGTTKDDYLGQDEAELGLGIHGEPGVSKIAFAPADELMALACARLSAALGGFAGRLAIILNNLGAVPPLEMGVLANAFMKTDLAKQCALIIGPAHLMTSLDMTGFSVSALELDGVREQALLAPVGASGWPGARQPGAITLVPLPETGRSETYAPSQNAAVQSVIRAVCDMLIAAEDTLNHLDSRIGDGDTGTTFATAARCVLDALDSLPCNDGAALGAALGALLSRNMGGSSGVLMAILFTAAGKAFEQGEDWPGALYEGAGQMMRYGGAREGDRTLLDALVPGLESLMQGKSIGAAATAARRGADATAALRQARAGRAAYVHEDNLAGVTDPGAEAIARAFETIAAIL
jgi:dihydroxyacetone kinase